MKILKMYVNRTSYQSSYYCVLDEIPQVTYEKVGNNYVGSAVDENGNIIFSDYLIYDPHPFRPAFGGRELTLHMKDGDIKKIKNYWFDAGYCEEHGEFIGIGAGTLDKLQECYVYCHFYINKKVFEEMLHDYYSRDKEYGYDEIGRFVKEQKSKGNKWIN